MNEEQLIEINNREKSYSHNKLQIENEELKYKNNELSNTIESINNEKMCLVKENSNLKELIESKKIEYNDLNNKYTQLNNNFNNLQKKHENDTNGHQNNIGHLNTQITGLKETLLKKDNLILDHTNKETEHLAKIEDLNNKKQTLTQLYSKLVDDKKSIEDELEHYINEYNISTNNNKELHDELALIKQNVKIQPINNPIQPISKLNGNIPDISSRGVKISKR